MINLKTLLGWISGILLIAAITLYFITSHPWTIIIYIIAVWVILFEIIIVVDNWKSDKRYKMRSIINLIALDVLVIVPVFLYARTVFLWILGSFGCLFVFAFIIDMISEYTKKEKIDNNPKDLLKDFSGGDLQNIEVLFTEGALNIPQLISYVLNIKKRHQLIGKEWAQIHHSLEQIITRNDDKTLYLGILGDFSSGKSTFINAALGFELLKEDVLQGTTCAPTILRYGSSLYIRIKFNDKKVPVIIQSKNLLWQQIWAFLGEDDWEKQLAELLPVLHEYTAQESIAATVAQVEITLPLHNPLLDAGIAIVDTPGLNSTNSRHEKITHQILHEICDTAMILSPAAIPAQKNLIDFVKHNLADIQNRCILMQTKTDEVHQKEREQQLKYVSERFFSETGTHFSAVFGTSAFYILDRDWHKLGINDKLKEQIPQFREEFNKSIKKINNILEAGRKIILLEKILHMLTDNLIPLLTGLIATKEMDYEKRKKELDNNQLTDLDSFLNDKNEQYKVHVSHVFITDQSINENIEKLKDLFEGKMYSKIYSAESRDELKSVMTESVITDVFHGLTQDIFKVYRDDICKPFAECTEKCLKDFHKEFADGYKRLENIGHTSDDAKIHVHSKNIKTDGISIRDFSEDVDLALAGDIVKTLGGAGVGALIGSVIPGVGTLLGAGIGAVIGLFFRKSLVTLQGEAYAKINDIAMTWREKLHKGAYDFVDNYRDICKVAIYNKLNTYKDEYEKRICTIIETEKNQQKNLLELIEHAQNDKANLKLIKDVAEKLLNDNTSNTK